MICEEENCRSRRATESGSEEPIGWGRLPGPSCQRVDEKASEVSWGKIRQGSPDSASLPHEPLTQESLPPHFVR